MQIDIEKISKLVTDSDRILFDPDGEAVLVELLKVQGQVDEAIAQAKLKIEQSALRLNPHFSSIQGDRVKVYYRAYGSRYMVDESQLKYIPKELYVAEKKVYYKVDGDAVEKWTSTHKGMPVGIHENERPKQLTFKLKSEVKDEK